MSSRLAKSTSKFRPVKPQQKKQATPTVVGTSSGGITPSASPAPPPSQLGSASLPASTPAQLDDDSTISIPADVATAVATATSEADIVQAPSASSEPPAITEPIPKSPHSQVEESATPAQSAIADASQAPTPTAPATQIPPSPRTKRIPAVLARAARAKALASSTPQEEPSASSTQDTQLSITARPSSSTTSRQGTPISFGGSSFAPGSWQDLGGATQVPTGSSTQNTIPDSQATVVAGSQNQKEPPSKEALVGKEVAVDDTAAAETSTQQTVPSSSIEISSQTRRSPSLSSNALPPLPTPAPAAVRPQTLPPLPPGHTLEDDSHIDGDDNDQDGEGEEESGARVSQQDGEVEASNEAPARKKRGRPAGSGRGAIAKGKKACTSRSKSKASRGADAEDEEEEGEENAENEKEEAEDGETALDGPGKKKKRKMPTAMATKRKAPAKSTKKPTKKKKKATPAEGEEGIDEAEEDEEYDENGEIIFEPWEISKLHPGYSLNTRDIYAAVGIQIPESFEFTTAQDIVEYNEEEEGEGEVAEGDEGEGNGYNEDGEQAEEEYQEDDDENGDGTTPWQPFGKAIDPTITTMRQLTEDTGRGRITPKLVKNMSDKITRKQMLKWAREKMKLRQSLRKAGLDPEAIERRLDEHMHALMHGGVIEFTEGDRSVPSGVRVTPNRLQTEEAASVRGDDDDDRGRNGTPYDGDTTGRPLFRPEENSDEEVNDESRHYDQDGTERGDDDDEDGYEGMMETQFAPQMRFVDGQFVLDESSTQIIRDTNAREGFAVVEDATDSRRITSASWGKRGKASRWTMADTDLFYEGLTQFGTDFELISRMFSNRTRRQIKAKFVREEKIDSARLEEALSGKKKIDINFYERMTKLDFRNGMVPADPMAKFYDGLPTADSAVKLESNREPSPSQELDLAALLRKKKEDTAGLGGWENSRAPQEYDGNGQEAIPEGEENEGEQYDGDHGDVAEAGHDEEMQGQYEHEEVPYRSPTPEQQDEPFSFSGGIQLRVSG